MNELKGVQEVINMKGLEPMVRLKCGQTWVKEVTITDTHTEIVCSGYCGGDVK